MEFYDFRSSLINFTVKVCSEDNVFINASNLCLKGMVQMEILLKLKIYLYFGVFILYLSSKQQIFWFQAGSTLKLQNR